MERHKLSLGRLMIRLINRQGVIVEMITNEMPKKQ